MEFLHDIFQAAMVQRLGWTLVHFVWQAAAIGIALAIALKLLRRSSANLRYAIGCMAMMLIVIIPAITFRMVYISVEAFDPVKAKQAGIVLSEVSAAMPVVSEMDRLEQPVEFVAASKVALKDRFINALEPALPYMVIGWLAGVFGLSLWHLGGWGQLQKLRRQMVKQVTPAVKAKLQKLVRALAIQKAVDIVESALVRVPTVVGHLKPVILLPASALTGLSTEQIEAILAHELAHIKRCDYLVNMLQTVVEILGFYHPAVWWVSRRIRLERENCCDDIAVSLCSDSLCYAKALATMEEIRSSAPAFAVAASGGSLLMRIKRLLGKDSSDETKLSWLPSAVAMVLITILLIPVYFAIGCGPSKQARMETSIEARQKELNDAQRVYVEWTEERFVELLDRSEYANLSELAKAELEEKWIAILRGPRNKKYYSSINSLAAIKSKKAVKPLLKIAAEHREKDNRDRWMAVRALGMIGDDSVVPELIHLVYHYNQNTRFWAQISLVRLTGENFETDWQQWGKWWNDKGRKPVCSNEKIEWTTRRVEYADTQKQKESDSRFVERYNDSKADIPVTSAINELGRIVDKIDYPFVDDPEAIGGWKSVDFVQDTDAFDPKKKNWQGDLFLKELFILDGGKTNWAFSWTRGLILHHGDKTASKYFIKEIDGVKFMFFEWKSGDYTIRHRKPSYYVLRKDEDMIYIESRTVDKTDYPFVDDKHVIGTWESVDFVSEMEQFKVGEKRWKGGKLFLNDMIFEENGKLTCKNNKVPNGYSRTWTKGLVINKRDETASRYHIKEIDGATYMFYEWKSGDYTIRGMKPKYYVLKKTKLTSEEIADVPVGKTSYSNSIYDVSELLELRNRELAELDLNSTLKEQAEEIVSEIKNNCVSSSWYSNGGKGKINIFNETQLVVWQLPQVHEMIDDYLKQKMNALYSKFGINETEQKTEPKVQYYGSPEAYPKNFLELLKRDQKMTDEQFEKFKLQLEESGKGISKHPVEVYFDECPDDDRPQIAIEARILRVDPKFLEEVGLDLKFEQAEFEDSEQGWGIKTEGRYYLGNSTDEQGLEQDIRSGQLDDSQVERILKATQEHGNSKVLTTPKVLVHDGEVGTMVIAKTTAYITGYNEPDNPAEKPEPKTEYIEEGVKLDFLPTIIEDDNIVLHVDFNRMEVLDALKQKYKGKYPYDLLTTEKTNIETRVVVANGQTILLGGMTTTSKRWIESGIPVLKSIPIIGGLFTNKSEIKYKQVLLLLIKPSISE